jgi:hypothetical protein
MDTSLNNSIYEEDDSPVNSITPIISDNYSNLDEKEKYNSQNSSILTNVIFKHIIEDEKPHKIEYIKYQKSPIIISEINSDDDSSKEKLHYSQLNKHPNEISTIKNIYFPGIITNNSKINNSSFSLNCSKECELCNDGKCLKCPKSTFSYLEKCYITCPGELFADNIDKTCKNENEKPVFSKSYTISRCVNSCGKDFFDCSCNINCVKNGTCCSDFKFCLVIDKINKIDTKIPNCKYSDEQDLICLQCKENFYYFNNECLKKCPNKNKNKENNNNENDIDNDNNTYNDNFFPKISSQKNSNVIIAYEENKICKEINISK